MNASITSRSAALCAAACYGVIVVFQIALAAGAPFGQASWGGQSKHLPTGYRVGSAIAVVIWAAAAVIVLARGGVVASQLSPRLLRRLTWALFGLSVLGTLMNAASTSRWERFGWAPFSLVLTIFLFLVARSDSAPTAGRE